METFTLEPDHAKQKRETKAWSYHNQPAGKDEWLTPPEIIAALGRFDLDPCSPINRPWETAESHWTVADNGLSKNWPHNLSVWCNPPYNNAAAWLSKCDAHNNAIALIFARTETKMFFNHVWGSADAILFIKGRLTFLNVDRTSPSFNSGAPSCLVAYGRDMASRLVNANISGAIKGKLIHL